jgi:hypothetical protein
MWVENAWMFSHSSKMSAKSCCCTITAHSVFLVLISLYHTRHSLYRLVCALHALFTCTVLCFMFLWLDTLILCCAMVAVS